MATTQNIKNHIKSVQDTKKITNAMYLIASTKMRKARADLERTRPYFKAIKGEIKRIFRTVEDVQSRYFYPDDGMPELNGTYACLVITADKGMAGMYNQNVIRQAEQLLQQHPDTKLFVVGEYGRHYFERMGIPVERSFLYTAQNPTMHRAREISTILLELYEKGQVQKIYVLYTDAKNSLCEEARLERLLPFHRGTFISNNSENEAPVHFEFTPGVQEVLDNIIPSYVSGYIYSALVDSFCSEQSARMNAMNSANQNAEKLLSTLSLQYNRLRQSAITQEITEVSAGAMARKRQLQLQNKENAK